jgi:hypothetical protein
MDNYSSTAPYVSIYINAYIYICIYAQVNIHINIYIYILGTLGSSLAAGEIKRLESESKLSKTKYEDLQKTFESQKLQLLEERKSIDKANMNQSGNPVTPQVGRGNVETAQLNALLTQMEYSETILKQRCLDSEAKTAAVEREKHALMDRTEKICLERDEALNLLDSKQLYMFNTQN